ncbi:MAG: glycoside hydrolase, partial [Prolixibacteraceae bacterium]|nr:glycoside hydrolase [Prolixibacteraceae bacterium]
MRKYLTLTFLLVLFLTAMAEQNSIVMNDSAYYERDGVNVLVFTNWYNENFSDSKMSGIEIIHHGKRTVTNGDVRLNRTPEQWDPIPEFIKKEVDREKGIIQAWLEYPEFGYMIKAEPDGEGLLISVHLEEALPDDMTGKAGFNIEFLPAAYFGKTYLMDDEPFIVPHYAAG